MKTTTAVPVSDFSQFTEAERPTRRRPIQVFLATLSQAMGEDSIKQVTLDKLSQLRQAHANLNTLASYVTSYSNSIRRWQQTIELTPENSFENPKGKKRDVHNGRTHYALNFLSLGDEVHRQRNAATDDKTERQRHNRVSFDPFAVIKVAEAALESDSYLERVAALELLLGRRPTEVMKLEGFKLTGRYTIEFSGQLKKRDGEAEPYTIYTLTEAHKIIAALDRLKREADLKELDGDTNKSIDSRRNSSANAAVRRVFGDILSPPVGDKRLSNKNLRAVYVNAAATLFKPMQRSMSSFAEQVLGHDGVSSIISYEDYVCSRGDGKEMPHGQWIDRLDDEAQKPKSRKKTTITVDGQRLERFKGIGGDDITHGERLDILLNTHDDYQAAQREIERLRRELKAAQNGGGKPKVNETKVAELKQKPQEELAADRTREGSIARMSRCVKAIKAWNEGKPNSEMYSLSKANIRYLSGARNDSVIKYYEARPELEEYNQAHGFSIQHDRGKTPIAEVITDW